jgi:shikimate dehydrogenase
MGDMNFTVIGNPIEHSLSPLIHQQFSASCGIQLQYDKTLLPKDISVSDFQDFLTQFAKKEGRGVNVTAPFKKIAYQAVPYKTPRAEQAQSVNTLIYTCRGDGHHPYTWVGDNTDGVGLLNDWARLGWEVTGKRILVIGAGGAVSGILGPLLALAPKEIMVLNRTPFVMPAKAGIQPQSYIPSDEPFDIVVNGLPRGIFSEDSSFVAKKAYDLNYHQEEAFTTWAEQRSATAVASGMGMLWAQAAESFLRWHGVIPDWEKLCEHYSNTHRVV